jgi:hypothetical protein
MELSAARTIDFGQLQTLKVARVHFKAGGDFRSGGGTHESKCAHFFLPKAKRTPSNLTSECTDHREKQARTQYVRTGNADLRLTVSALGR